MVVVTGSLLFTSQSWFRTFFEYQLTGILFSASEEASKKLQELNTTAQKLTRELNKNQEKVNNQQLELDEAQSNIQEATAKLAEQQTKLATTQKQLEITANQLKEQQDKLKTVEAIVNGILGSKKTLMFRPDNETMMYEKSSNEEIYIVYFRLPDIPINSTVRIQYHIYSQPTTAHYIRDNIILFRWADNESQLKSKPFVIEYIADPNSSDKIRNLIKDETGNVKIEGLPNAFGVWHPLYNKADDVE